MEGFSAYRTFLALKRHFTTNYNYFKYHGKVKVSEESYAKRRDRFVFEKIQRKYPDEYEQYFIANLLKNPNEWVGNFSDDVYTEWKKAHRSTEYRFKQELTLIREYMEEHSVSFINLLKAEKNEHPILLKMYMLGWIHINTLCILEIILHFLDVWEQRHDDPLTKDQIVTFRNYLGFLSLDRRKYMQLLKQIIYTE